MEGRAALPSGWILVLLGGIAPMRVFQSGLKAIERAKPCCAPVQDAADPGPPLSPPPVTNRAITMKAVVLGLGRLALVGGSRRAAQALRHECARPARLLMDQRGGCRALRTAAPVSARPQP